MHHTISKGNLELVSRVGLVWCNNYDNFQLSFIKNQKNENTKNLFNSNIDNISNYE